MTLSIVCHLTMNNINIEQRVDILQYYFKNGESIRETRRKLREIYGRHGVPSELAIRRTMDNFFSTQSLHNAPRPITVRIPENIAAVGASVRESPNLSIRRRAQTVGLPKSSTGKILGFYSLFWLI